MKRALLMSALLLVLGACGEDVAPASYVDKFRILSVTATPPDIKPDETTVLRALAVDPSRPGKPSTLIWLACDPDPLDLRRSSCSDVSTLSDPGAFTPPEGGDLSNTELPPGVRAIGFGPFAAYRAPAETFNQLDAADPRRIQGAVAQVLVIAIAAELPPNPNQEQRDALFAKVRSKEIASQLVIFRIRVTEDPQRNSNPVLSELKVEDEALPEGATVRLRKDRDTKLELVAAEDQFEEYDQETPSGLEHKREQLIAALYSTTGRFLYERLEVGSGTEEAFQAPDGEKNNPVPEDGRGVMWVVLRDTRGGQSFIERPFFLCDEALPAPAVEALTPAQGAADGTQRVTLSGKDLSSVLDVLVGGKALLGSSYDAARGVFEGLVPALPPGEHVIKVRGQHCADVETPFTYRSP